MTDPVTNIIVITHQDEFLDNITQILNPIPSLFFCAKSLNQALEVIRDQNIHISIIDLNCELTQKSSKAAAESMYALTDGLRSSESAKNVPLILVGSGNPDRRRISSYQKSGPTSYLSKPILPIILHAEVLNFISLLKVREEYQKLADEDTLLKLELSRRNKQLAISSQVARHISSILDLDELLHGIVELIQTQFKFYYVSIWLISPGSKSIELRAGSYDSGRSIIMLEPGFSLSLGNDKSIITQVCKTQTTYIAQDTAQDPFYLATEALPFTQAEMTLPLQARGQLLGVIDIESDRTNAFHPDDVEILATLADQTAIAVRNASLYNEVLRSREELEEKILTRTKELRETNQQLEMLEQNKTDFIQVLSHELRTPLTLVSGYAELLMFHELAESDPFFRQPVLGVMTGAKRLHELIDSMVDMLKIDSRSLQLMPQIIAVESILAPIIETLADALDKRQLNLTIEGIDTLPDIEGDLELLSKVFDQLITNAIKYTPDGGQILITGRHLHQDFNGVLEEFIEISISDTGIGISHEHLDIIFTKFYRTGDVSQHSSGKIKFKGGGPGLGLSIAKGIVEAHQGRIWAESPGYDEVSCPGSCFYVLLPLTQKL